MEQTNLDAKKPTPDTWIQKRQTKVIDILAALRQVKNFSLDKSPVEDLNSMHTSLAGLRNYQEWIKTHMVEALGMELEVKRMLALCEMDYKDQLGKAFTERADIVAQGKSFEEKTLRLREHLPIIREKEEWEHILEHVESLKQAVQFVYDDLNRGAMAIASHINIIRNQILTGQIKIQVDGFTAKAIISDNTLDAVEKAAMNNLPKGELSFDKL